MRGRSPGKAVFGLRAVTVEGAPATARHAFIRSSVGIVDFLIPPSGSVPSSRRSCRRSRSGSATSSPAPSCCASGPRRRRRPRSGSGRPRGWRATPTRSTSRPSPTHSSPWSGRSWCTSRSSRRRPATRWRCGSRRPSRRRCTIRPRPACTPSCSWSASQPPTSDAGGHWPRRRVPTARRRPRRGPCPRLRRPHRHRPRLRLRRRPLRRIARSCPRPTMPPPAEMLERWHFLDHTATTPLRPEALAAMVPALKDGVGNPSGAHTLARRARTTLDAAREELAAVVGCEPGEHVHERRHRGRQPRGRRGPRPRVTARWCAARSSTTPSSTPSPGSVGELFPSTAEGSSIWMPWRARAR